MSTELCPSCSTPTSPCFDCLMHSYQFDDNAFVVKRTTTTTTTTSHVSLSGSEIPATKKARRDITTTSTLVFCFPTEIWELIKDYLFFLSAKNFGIPLYRNVYQQFLRTTKHLRMASFVFQRPKNYPPPAPQPLFPSTPLPTPVIKEPTGTYLYVSRNHHTFLDIEVAYLQIKKLKESDGIVSFVRGSYGKGNCTGTTDIFHFKREKRRLYFIKDFVTREEYTFENQRKEDVLCKMGETPTSTSVTINQAIEKWSCPRQLTADTVWNKTTMTEFLHNDHFSGLLRIVPTCPIYMYTMISTPVFDDFH